MFILANGFRVFQAIDGPIILVSVVRKNWLFWVCVLLECLSLPTMTLLPTVLNECQCPNPDFLLRYHSLFYSQISSLKFTFSCILAQTILICFSHCINLKLQADPLSSETDLSILESEIPVLEMSLMPD